MAIDLLANAEVQQASFMSFIYRWMAFNGWMSAVTLKDTDREMQSRAIQPVEVDMKSEDLKRALAL